ncbi:hypothetical protein [Novosphingobium olei]|uniref:hypothetical protein n=1 Tax=Novosphingobium olei TaxID=2728851 RepID=UPI003084A110|nr:hypothetical protein NSDW_08040 [Novosphingobium olei]
MTELPEPDLRKGAAHRAPLAANLFHGPATEAAATRPAIPLIERDHFTEHFAIDFAAALNRHG